MTNNLRYLLPRNQWGDAVFAWLRYRSRQGRFPERRDPKLFNDHLYRMKVDGMLLDPLRQFVSDKEYVKLYIAGVVGKKYTLEAYQLIRTETEVDQLVLNKLPCVVKPTHASGPVRFYTESDALPDRELFRKWLKLDYYKRKREQNYRYLLPKIIVEEFFSRDGRTPPPDYKFHCFFGVPKLIQVDSNRFTRHTRNLYDTLWNLLPVSFGYPESSDKDIRPSELEEMLDVAARLSQPFSYIRIDMYAIDGEVRVGELTNCPGSAGERVRPSSAELALGRLFEPGHVLGEM